MIAADPPLLLTLFRPTDPDMFPRRELGPGEVARVLHRATARGLTPLLDRSLRQSNTHIISSAWLRSLRKSFVVLSRAPQRWGHAILMSSSGRSVKRHSLVL